MTLSPQINVRIAPGVSCGATFINGVKMRQILWLFGPSFRPVTMTVNEELAVCLRDRQ